MSRALKSHRQPEPNISGIWNFPNNVPLIRNSLPTLAFISLPDASLQQVDHFGGRTIPEILLTRGSPRVQSRRRGDRKTKVNRKLVERSEIPTLYDLPAAPPLKANDRERKSAPRPTR